MKKTIITITLLAGIALTLGVIMPPTATAQEHSVNVYSAGTYRDGNKTIACYWKNGVRQNLDLQGINGYSSAFAITVSGNSVYVAGWYFDEKWERYATYWKDGIRQNLDLQGTKNSRTNAITVSGNSVYVTGYSTVGNTFTDVALYWKDGIRQRLDRIGSRSSYTTAITVSGNSVYVVGYYYVSSEGTLPCYWKDGIQQSLDLQSIDRMTPHNAANAITVSDNSVYIAGKIHSGQSILALYWKDGIQQTLDNQNLPVRSVFGTEARAITLVGTNVYVAGNYEYSDNSIRRRNPYYWKNGARHNLKLSNTPFHTVHAIAISGTTVYVAGSYYDYDWDKSLILNLHQCYWKDDVLFDFGVINGEIMSTYITIN